MPFGFYDAVSIGLYWFLVVLWAVVVLVFLTRYDQPKAEEPKITLFFRMLLVLGFAILLLDSIYFSTLFGTPQAQTLGTLRSLLGNESLLLPKLALLGTAIAIVYGIFRQGMKEMEAETRNMQKISALNAIASTVSQSLDLDQVLGTTLDKVLEVLEIEAGEIILRDEQTNLPQVAARRGPRMPESEIAYQAVAEVLAGGDIRMIEEYGPENQAFASIPLRSKENILGAMNIYAHPDQPLSQRDLELLAAVGNQIGVAIENASLFRNLNIAYQELSSTQAQLFQSAKLSAVGELAAGIAHEIANPLST
ncbi:MAG: GAF domain-containing protein, partial [Chloroflexi bacterium]|nr:GAF domain-containing protein [Chloroflexota bacterium]